MKARKIDNLAICAIAATDAGMTYGKYMAKYNWHPPVTRQEPDLSAWDDLRICQCCGQPFHGDYHFRRFCSYECRYLYGNMRKRKGFAKQQH